MNDCLISIEEHTPLIPLLPSVDKFVVSTEGGRGSCEAAGCIIKFNLQLKLVEAGCCCIKNKKLTFYLYLHPYPFLYNLYPCVSS